MAAPNLKSTSLLPELHAYLKTFPAEYAYEKLADKLLADGWTWQLRQNGAPEQGSNGVIVNFDVLIGKDGPALERVDMISMSVPPLTGPLSLLARMQATTTLIYMFFGRLPPQPAPVAQPEPARSVRVEAAPDSEKDIYLPEPDPEDDAGQEYLPDPAVAPPLVVGKRTPDGLPVFVDLYALGVPSAMVIKAVLGELDAAMPDIETVEQLGALYSKNEEAMEFIKDLGTTGDLDKLKKLFDKRKGQLAGGVVDLPPRRRSAAR